MQNRRNYYRILHVQPDAPAKVIESSYRTLMLTLKQHPDLGGDHWNASLINEAHGVLSDPDKRVEYDRSLKPRRALPEFARSGENSSRTSKENVSEIYDLTGDLCVFCKSPISVDPTNNPDALCINCNSPLYPVVSMSGGNSSKRAVQRVQLLKPIQVYSQWPLQQKIVAILKNLSPNGLQFTCQSPLHINQIIKIESESFAAVGRVTNQIDDNKSGYVVGAEFLTLQFQQSSGTFISTRV